MNIGITLGLRFLAFLIDLGISFGVVALSFSLTGFLVDKTDGIIGIFIFFISFPLSLASPFIYLGVTTGLWGRTLGKWICRLRVVDKDGERIGFWRGIGRESFKVLIVYTHIGALIALIQCAMGKVAFHDVLCGTDVEFIGGLTDTQRNWRKNYNRF